MRTTYEIEGNLDDTGWIAYAPLGQCTEDQARDIYAAWQLSRDRMGSAIRYRLTRQVATTETLTTELPSTHAMDAKTRHGRHLYREHTMDDGKPPRKRRKSPTGAKCGAPRAKGAGPCKRPAGYGTDHLGYGHCKSHFGNAPNQIRQAQVIMTEDAANQFGLAIETTAEDALLQALYHANGAVAFYRGRVMELTREQMTYGSDRITRVRRADPDAPGGEVIEDTTIAKSQPHIWIVLLERAETHRLKVAATVAQLKIEDRRIKVAEKLGEQFYEALLLTMRQQNLNPGQQSAIIQGLPQAMAVVTGEVLEG